MCFVGKLWFYQGDEQADGRIQLFSRGLSWYVRRGCLHGGRKILHSNNYRFDIVFVLEHYSNQPIFHIPNSFCKMFEKRAPISLKIDSQFLQSVSQVGPSRRKLYPFASKVCKKTYLNKIFIWENFLSDFLPILLIKRDNCGILRIKNKHMDQIRPSDARIKCRCFQA